MKKYISVIAAILVVAFSACAKKASKTPSVTYVKMERTACFGRCPAYMVEIYKNGLIRYTGRQFTEYTGVYESNIGSKEATKLLKKFADNRVDTCREVYDNNIPDLPGLYFGFKINGKDKTIANASFGPKYFGTLSNEVDKYAKPGIGWKKVSDLTPKQ